MKELIEFLEKHESIEEVKEEVNRLTASLNLNIEKFYQKDNIEELIEFLKKHKFIEEVNRLTTLKVDGGPDGSETVLYNKNIKSFTKALENNNTITSLKIIRNDIGDIEIIEVLKIKVLKGNNTLTSLDLSVNGITDKGVAKIGEFLELNTLKSLSLDTNSITDIGSAIIVKALNGNTSLTELSLAYNNISDATIIEALNYNILTSLILKGNFIADDGATKIGEYLANNNSLTFLDLSTNRIENGDRIGEALRNNNTLTYLDLSENKIEFAAGIASGLKNNSTITSLPIYRIEYDYESSYPFEVNPIGIEEITKKIELNCKLFEKFSSLLYDYFNDSNKI
ncbi:MAG: hypothetical protein LN567_05110 [Rickettsia endosymbiont of Graphium doson]|nr:hypothetical protein [Rickettsia endosymbiont of Graphium doson]